MINITVDGNVVTLVSLLLFSSFLPYVIPSLHTCFPFPPFSSSLAPANIPRPATYSFGRPLKARVNSKSRHVNSLMAVVRGSLFLSATPHKGHQSHSFVLPRILYRRDTHTRTQNQYTENRTRREEEEEVRVALYIFTCSHTATPPSFSVARLSLPFYKCSSPRLPAPWCVLPPNTFPAAPPVIPKPLATHVPYLPASLVCLSA